MQHVKSGTSAATYKLMEPHWQDYLGATLQDGTKRWASPGLFFVYFHLYAQIILVASRIRTRNVGVDGKIADH